jgi:hypothetical protein
MPATGRSSSAARVAAEKYRRERPALSSDERAALTRIAADIGDPVMKLRYLQSAAGAPGKAVVERLPYAPLRRGLYRLEGLATLDAFARETGARAVIKARTLSARFNARIARIAVITGAILFVPLLLAGVAFGIDPKARAQPRTTVAAVVHTPAPVATRTEPPPPAATGTLAEPLTPAPRSQTPAIIWLADRGRGWELYSNGLRIETRNVVSGEPRRFRIHDRTEGLQSTVYTHPVGILFHTSESDLWPLEPDYGSQLRQSSTRLLAYVRANQSYNYVIDRFGRVYRVVDDDGRANHAGHAVWGRGDDVYLDLNAAFLGVSFETRWEGGHALPITVAQLNAGRNLTDYLRQRFAIAPEMCVTHGLASVSAKQQLIGYHLDWARAFPFAAFGLPDQYAVATPSIALFGFGYDARFLHDVGEPWPGVAAAEQSLARDAAARGIAVETLRTERRALYRQWTKEIRSGSGAAGASATQQPADTRG